MAIQIPEGFGLWTLLFSGPSSVGSAPVVTFGSSYSPTSMELANVTTFLVSNLPDMLGNAYAFLGTIFVTETVSITSPANSPGTRSAAQASPATSVLVRKTTGERGRKNQGRSYWPGMLLDSEVSDSGTITEDRLDDLQAFMNDLIGTFAETDDIMVVLHNGPEAPTPVQTYDVEAVVATQRRRLRS